MFYGDINKFKEENGYEIDGIWYPRVTAIVGIKAKPALYKFYADLPSFEAGEAIKNKSAEEGTMIHNAVESILKHDSTPIPTSIKPAISAFQEFYSRNNIIAHKIEERVISKKHHYAGTMDVLAEINGKLGVLDIKTSVAIYRDYSMQTSAYIEALRENQNMPPLARWILRLDQSKKCLKCSATLREKGGREKIRKGSTKCIHSWGPMEGEYELKEITTFNEDIKAFLACKELWSWENNYLLKKVFDRYY